MFSFSTSEGCSYGPALLCESCFHQRTPGKGNRSGIRASTPPPAAVKSEWKGPRLRWLGLRFMGFTPPPQWQSHRPPREEVQAGCWESRPRGAGGWAGPGPRPRRGSLRTPLPTYTYASRGGCSDCAGSPAPRGSCGCRSRGGALGRRG